MSKTFLKSSHIQEAARRVYLEILADLPDQAVPHPLLLHGVPRGGIPAAYAVQGEFLKHSHACEIVDSPEAAHLIIDDLIDSGTTAKRYRDAHPGKMFYALFGPEREGQDWLVFPWEQGEGTTDTSADDIPLRLLQYIDEDPTRGGLLETPKRFLKAWKHYTNGYDADIQSILKTFKDGAEDCDEMVLVRNIPVYSHCEHHLAPFFGMAHIGYIPDGKIVGLSKLPRLVDAFAHRLQVQERLTNQIADAMQEHLGPKGIAVVIECRHMCMEARGIERQGSSTVTSAMRGAMKENAMARAEFMALIK